MKKVALLFVLLLTACGYQFVGGGLPGDVKTLYLPLAQNKTTEPLLENFLAGPLNAVLARQKGVVLSNAPSHADAVLAASIERYQVEPLAYDSNDRISEYRASMTVHFALKRRADNALLWQGTLQRNQSYTAAVDKNLQQDLEAAAIEIIARDLADDLAYRLLTRF